MRQRLIGITAAAVMGVGLILPGSAHAAPAGGGKGGGNGFTMAIFGDLPYGNTQGPFKSPPTAIDDVQYQKSGAFIAAVNADPDVSLVGMVGDIHSGKEFCTTAYDDKIAALWTGFQDPLVYTPGDNEWSDCQKPGEGGGKYNATTGQIDFSPSGDPLHPAACDPDCYGHVSYADGDPKANLDYVRSQFFATPGATLGGGKVKVTSQAGAFDPAHPEDAQFVENVRWERKDIMFVTLNIPVGSNDDADKWHGLPSQPADQQADRAQRPAANLRWLDAAFAVAKANGDKGLVIMEQADMWDTDHKANHIGNYKAYIDRIATNTLDFAKPVLLFNGDSHTFRSDNPLVDNADCVIEDPAAPTSTTACANVLPDGLANSNPADPYDTQPWGYNVANFHRVVVHGSTLPFEYVRLTIDGGANAVPSATTIGPFSWTQQGVPTP